MKKSQHQIFIEKKYPDLDPKMVERLLVNREISHLRTKLEVRTIALRVSLSINSAFITALTLRILLK